MTWALRFFLLIVFSVCCGAQEIPWVLLERGKAAFESRDITTAMEYILEAVETMDEYPEAEYWLGRVYAAQGQAVMAEEQYRRALNLAIYLRVPDDRFQILYSLAELLLKTGGSRRSESELILMEIADSEGASSSSEVELEHRYIEYFVTRGLDELLYLYRSELRQSLKARRMLGEIAWEDGRYRSSLLHSLRTILSLLSTVSGQYREYRPEWRFDINLEEDARYPDRDVRYPGDLDGAAELLELVRDHYPLLLQWLGDSGFWPQFYLLSVSLYAEGYVERAESLWRFLAENEISRSVSGRWGLLARRQLEEPFITTGTLSP